MMNARTMFATFFLSLLLVNTTMAQKPYETTIDFKRMKRPAVCMQVYASAEAADKALYEELAKEGLPSRNLGDFREYANVTFSKFGKENITIYTAVRKADKNYPNTSFVYILVSNSSGVFIKSDTDPQMVQQVKNYLENYHIAAKRVDADLQIERQIDLITKGDKYLFNLNRDSLDLEKKRKDIEIKINENKNNLQMQRTEIKRQEQILDNLRRKREEMD